MTNLIIPKEQISAHQLVNGLASNDKNLFIRLKDELYRAMLMGNTTRSKVRIELNTINGPVAVETTVWASTDKHVTLKGGINIPFRYINEVFIY